MGFATKWKTKKLRAKEWSKRHIFLSHFFIFHHKPKRMLKFLRNGFWIVIVQKVRKKCLSHSGKMHFFVSGHVTLGVVWWRHELDYICPLWVLSKFGAIEAYMCRVIADWFFPSNGIKRYFNGPLIAHATIACHTSVFVARAKMTQVTSRSNKNHFSTWKALNLFGICSDSFTLRSNMCSRLGPKKFGKKIW